MDSCWVSLYSLRIGIVIPKSILTISFTQSLYEYHKGQCPYEQEIIYGPNVTRLHQQIMSLLKSIDSGWVLQRRDKRPVRSIASMINVSFLLEIPLKPIAPLLLCDRLRPSEKQRHFILLLILIITPLSFFLIIISFIEKCLRFYQNSKSRTT